MKDDQTQQINHITIIDLINLQRQLNLNLPFIKFALSNGDTAASLLIQTIEQGVDDILGSFKDKEFSVKDEIAQQYELALSKHSGRKEDLDHSTPIKRALYTWLGIKYKQSNSSSTTKYIETIETFASAADKIINYIIKKLFVSKIDDCVRNMYGQAQGYRQVKLQGFMKACKQDRINYKKLQSKAAPSGSNGMTHQKKDEVIDLSRGSDGEIDLTGDSDEVATGDDHNNSTSKSNPKNSPGKSKAVKTHAVSEFNYAEVDVHKEMYGYDTGRFLDGHKMEKMRLPYYLRSPNSKSSPGKFMPVNYSALLNVIHSYYELSQNEKKLISAFSESAKNDLFSHTFFNRLSKKIVDFLPVFLLDRIVVPSILEAIKKIILLNPNPTHLAKKIITSLNSIESELPLPHKPLNYYMDLFRDAILHHTMLENDFHDNTTDNTTVYEVCETDFTVTEQCCLNQSCAECSPSYALKIMIKKIYNIKFYEFITHLEYTSAEFEKMMEKSKGPILQKDMLHDAAFNRFLKLITDTCKKRIYELFTDKYRAMTAEKWDRIIKDELTQFQSQNNTDFLKYFVDPFHWGIIRTARLQDSPVAYINEKHREELIHGFLDTTGSSNINFGIFFNTNPSDDPSQNNAEFCCTPTELGYLPMMKMTREVQPGEEIHVDYGALYELKGVSIDKESRTGEKRGRDDSAGLPTHGKRTKKNRKTFDPGENIDDTEVLRAKAASKKTFRQSVFTEFRKRRPAWYNENLELNFTKETGFYITAKKTIHENTILGVYNGFLTTEKGHDRLTKIYHGLGFFKQTSRRRVRTGDKSTDGQLRKYAIRSWHPDPQPADYICFTSPVTDEVSGRQPLPLGKASEKNTNGAMKSSPITM
jgi:hypothetical protein